MTEPSIPYRVARRVLSGELTHDQAVMVANGGKSIDPQPSSKLRQRESRGDDGLNATERRYRDEVLEPKLREREIARYWMPCPIKLMIGKTWKSTFTGDALIEGAGGELIVVDVKATMRVVRAGGGIGHVPLSQDDARAKIHAASALYPCIRFVVAHPIPRKDGGGWREIEI